MTPPRPAALLEVRDLRVGYGNVPVLGGVSFTVEAGTTTVLLGLNGAGKTTTVSTVAGLHRSWSGSITFAGERIDHLDAPTRVERGLVLVPEGRRVFPALTVSQNLRMGAWVHRRRPAVLRSAEERVLGYFPRLAERLDQLAGTLSGGEQQMLALGRGLMSLPRLMLIDEASLGLSPRLAGVVFEVVSRLTDDGVTVLMVEQNASALRYAGRALVMEKGRFVWDGPPAELGQDSLRRTYLGTS